MDPDDRTPAAIRDFLGRVGVAKVDSVVETAMLEHCVREDLNAHAPRMMAVIDPVKLVIENWPADKTEDILLENHPNIPDMGTRTLSFGREVYIEREDFMEEKVGKFFRLYPGNEVRLKGAYVVKCTGCVKDENGNVTEVLAEYDPDSRGGDPADGRKIKSTIHWVDAATAVDAEIRLYDNLFVDSDPDGEGKDFMTCLNPDSFETLTGCKVEQGLRDATFPAAFQFMRQGYFCLDNKDSAPGRLVFNRSVSLKDGFKK
ncbi:Glutamine--tRNA ligase [bioreactor metagenome]|uniref:Glutamine--tRNA ligase n=1 Tax=bioreactor metagenome TaxID=1076179 RepID=A0A645FWB8_9ZZZZ